MSDLLDPSSRFHLLRTGLTAGWHCLEVGAGNGSLSQWLAERVGPRGQVIATDLRPDLMQGIAGGNLEVRKFDVVHDEPPGASFDLVAIRALLHHLPERRAVVTRLARWLKPGGWLFVQEPDFYPTWTVEPPSQRQFWEKFVGWAASHQIDYYVGRKVPAWLQAEGLSDISSEGHAILYNGSSEFAAWWDCGIREVSERLQERGRRVRGHARRVLSRCTRDPPIGRRPSLSRRPPHGRTSRHRPSNVPRDRSALRRLSIPKVEEHLVDVAPAPAFGRVIAFDDRMPGRVEVLRRVTVGGIVAAADMAAGAAEPQMHPRRSALQALLAAERAWRHVARIGRRACIRQPSGSPVSAGRSGARRRTRDRRAAPRPPARLRRPRPRRA